MCYDPHCFIPLVKRVGMKRITFLIFFFLGTSCFCQPDLEKVRRYKVLNKKKTTKLENKKTPRPFNGLIGNYQPLLAFITDTVRYENETKPYDYQQHSQGRIQRIAEIRKLIEERSPDNSGHRKVGLRLVLPPAYSDDNLKSNRVLIIGPSGVGKTRTVRAIAHESDSEFIPLINPTGSYHAEGQEILYRSFLEALLKAMESGKRVAFYLDECHIYASKNAEHSVDETTKTLLWQILDKYAHDPRVCFFASSHEEDKVDPTFKRRWKIIKFDKPTEQERKDIIVQEAERNGFDISEDYAKKLAKEVNEATGANITQLFEHAADELESRGLGNVEINYLKEELKTIVENTTTPKEKEPTPEVVLYIGRTANAIFIGSASICTAALVQLGAKMAAEKYGKKSS